MKRTVGKIAKIVAVSLWATAACTAAAAQASSASLPLYANPRADPEARITDLLTRMTLDEKIQALSTNPSVPRLGVVGTNHVEGLHGLALGGPGHWEGHNLAVIPTTQFPQARGLGQTWDPELIERAAAEEAYETRYGFGKYHRGSLVVRAPNADLSRDPRWGRSEESYGEDPILVGTMATAFARGLQGSDPHVWMTASLLKHFLANSNEDNRAASSSNFDERLFHEYYAIPFRMAVEDGHADAMMTAYNAWNGIPMAANPVLRAVVMKDWGFNGILCTDAGALTDMVTQHHTFPDLATAAAAAIHAGINQFLDNYRKPVEDALARGLITEADIDANLRGVYRVMLRLGLLNPAADSPYARVGERGGVPGDPWNDTAVRRLARQVTDESIVLLKNTDETLPLDASTTRSVAVIGPWANLVALDWYSGTPPFAVTPLQGIRKSLPDAVVSFNDGSDVATAAELATHSQVAVVIVGNHPTCNAGWDVCADPSEGKEAIDRKNLTLTEEGLVKAVLKANPHTVVVLQTSFPYTTVWTEKHAPAILEMTHNSEEQGDALADVLFGSFNPSGKLTQTWPASIDQLPPMMDYNIRHGRTYMYTKSTPLYPFGYGLSYTQFHYSSMHAAESEGAVHIRLTLNNTGKRNGAEVVQIYAAHEISQVSRPLQQLVAFQRVTVPAGASREAAFDVPLDRLAYWDEAEKRFVVERDRVEFRAGSSSADIRLKTVLAIGPAEPNSGVLHGGK